MEKVKVGLSWAHYTEKNSSTPYVKAVEKAGGAPILLPEVTCMEEARDALNNVQALVMTGGEDINPALYGEEKSEKCEKIDFERDVSDTNYILAALESDMPLLAICRGMQLLNVLLGGTLYQDLPSETKSFVTHRDENRKVFIHHTAFFKTGNILFSALGLSSSSEGGETLTVNSWHHQAIKKMGRTLFPVAKAQDGIIEAVVKTDAKFVIGVQFHPEEDASCGDVTFLALFVALINAAKN